MLKKLLRLFLFFIMSLFIANCSTSGDEKDDDKIIEGQITVLVLSNDSNDNNFIDTSFSNHMSNFTFISMNVEDSLPSVEDFAGIDVILLFENGYFDNASLVGDILYAYVMAGGNLVTGTFYWQDRTDEEGGGNWGFLEMIDPLFGGSCDYLYDSLGVVNSHYMTNGVDSLYLYYRGGVDTLRSNATALAWWADGDPLIAYNKPDGTITAVTAFPAEFNHADEYFSTSFHRMWENVLRWTASQGSGFSKSSFKNSTPKKSIISSESGKTDGGTLTKR